MDLKVKSSTLFNFDHGLTCSLFSHEESVNTLSERLELGCTVVEYSTALWWFTSKDLIV